MEPMRRITAVAVPMLRSNVDTDAIIPSREIRSVGKTGLAPGLFAGWRYLDAGSRQADPEFVLNKPEYAGAQILLAGENFGCGSSREHAVWALREYGFRAILAPSFAPIFMRNCVHNGVAPVILAQTAVAAIAAAVQADPAHNPVTVDVEQGVALARGTEPYPFALDSNAREMLLEGLDFLGLALKRRAAIAAFLSRDRTDRSWIYLI
ncbi:MAG: 3-isopropylmalate dehydratase small subunit [Gammaproteobacteria bacterium]|nr:3-isopropylmalate dehydratase small subunit [Gammaproteobacteria bacterium]